MTWQTMDTAPKDGTWVLLGGGELGDQRSEVDFGKHPVVAQWASAPMLGWLVADFDDGYGLGVYYVRPKCWMPIESLPADMVVAA